MFCSNCNFYSHDHDLKKCPKCGTPKQLYTCACCGYKTLDEPTGETYEICQVCWWEQNNLQQLGDTHDASGPNYVSIRDAQENFIKHGICEPRRKDLLAMAREAQKSGHFVKDPTWKSIAELGDAEMERRRNEWQSNLRITFHTPEGTLMVEGDDAYSQRKEEEE